MEAPDTRSNAGCYRIYDGVYHTPLSLFSMLDISTAGVVSVPKKGRRWTHLATGPVAAARAAVATGAWVKSKHDMYLIRGSVGA